MTTSVADLSINVAANIANAVEGMARLGRSVDGAADRIVNLQSVAGNFARTFATTLAGAFSVGALTEMAVGVVRAAASLDDLSEKTGASVESLSRFAGVARITGQDVGSIESSMSKLSKSLSEAQDGGSKAASAFSAFGINIRDASGNLRNSGEVMDELARKQQGFGDGATKAAAMMQLLGRSGAEIIPFLNDYVRLSGEVTETTAEQAAQAEDLSIQIGLMQERINALARGTLLPLIPQIMEVIRSFESLGRAINDLSPSGRGPLEGFLESIRETNRQTIGELAFLVQAWEDARKWFRDKPLIEFGRRDQQNLGQNFRELFSGASAARESAMLAASNRELAEVTRSLPPLMEATAGATGKAAVQFSAASSGVDKFAQALGAMQKSLRSAEADAMNLGRAIGDQIAPSIKKLEDMMNSPAWAKWSEGQRDAIRSAAENEAGIYRLVAAYKAQQDVQAELVRIRERTAAIEQRALESLNNYTDGLEKQLEALRREGEEIGRTDEELNRLTLSRIDDTIRAKEQVLASYENVEGGEAYADVLRTQIGLLQQIKTQTASNQASASFAQQAEESRRAWVTALEDITNAGAGFIEDFLQNGSKAFENLWENFKRWALAAFARIAAQEIVVSIVGSIGGGAGGGGGIGGTLSSLLGGGGGKGIGGLLGDGLSGIGSLISGLGGGAGGLFGGIGGALSNIAVEGLIGGTLTNLAGIAGSFGAGTAAGVIGGIGTAIGAAIPVVGIALAIASAFGAFDPSIPKTGGSGGQGINLGNGQQWGIDQRMFGPNDNDAAVQKLVNSITTDFGKIANALGANSGGFGFLLGYDAHEEHGNRVSGLVQDVAGNTIYEAKDIDAGDDIEGALSLQAQRAILAALQAAEMPAYLADVFDSLVATEASASEIQGVIEFAQGLKIVVDTVQGLGEQFSAIDPADIQGFVEAFGGLEPMLQGLSFIGQNFYTDAQKLEAATAQLNGVFEGLGRAVPETRSSRFSKASTLRPRKTANSIKHSSPSLRCMRKSTAARRMPLTHWATSTTRSTTLAMPSIVSANQSSNSPTARRFKGGRAACLRRSSLALRASPALSMARSATASLSA
jgi:hypothetical protein